ncbi:MAG: hypothetical protein JWO03_1717 [Bacteroidetes bacterium]|nr:hypothetical protein [Bacteroidota bacterium]
MRTLDLIKAFSDNELGELKELISESDKPKQIRLFDELCKAMLRDKEPDNSILFKKILGKTYTKAQDYLLRHELRTLNETLYLYLAKQTAQAHIDKKGDLYSYWLARGYYDRHMHGFFRAHVTDAIKELMPYEETAIPSIGAAIHSLRSLWMFETLSHQPESFAQQQEAVQKWKQEEKKRFLYRMREIEAREAFIVDAMYTYSVTEDQIPIDERTPGDLVIDFSDVGEGDIYLRYIELKKHTLQTRNELRIEVLKETLTLIDTPKGKEILGFKAKQYILSKLGLSLRAMGRFEDADIYMAQYIAECEEHKWPLIPAAVYNYMANQVNLERYNRAIEIYQQYKDLLYTDITKHASLVTLAYCYLFLGDESQAIKVLPKDPALPAAFQIISRLVNAISFLMREEHALAVYEINNLKRTIKSGKTGTSSIALQIADLYLRYAKAFTKNKDERVKILSCLKAEMQENYEVWHVKAGMGVQLHWLVKKLQS